MQAGSLGLATSSMIVAAESSRVKMGDSVRMRVA
jgi:hypothetical protein